MLRLDRIANGFPDRYPDRVLTIDSHTEGEPTRLLIGGLGPLPGDTMKAKRDHFESHFDTVRMLLTKVHAALPDGGRLIVAEPMSGGQTPIRATDAYFAVYCMAMRTGRVRSAEEISDLLHAAGFVSVKPRQTARPFITGLVTARKC
jgi:demethylspheroidene O-methyltransferase